MFFTPPKLLCQGHQWPLCCWMQWSLLSPHLTWPASCIDPLDALFLEGFIWLSGLDALPVFLLSHWLLSSHPLLVLTLLPELFTLGCPQVVLGPHPFSIYIHFYGDPIQSYVFQYCLSAERVQIWSPPARLRSNCILNISFRSLIDISNLTLQNWISDLSPKSVLLTAPPFQ